MTIFENYTQHVPDTLKVSTAISAPVLTFLGVSVEQWTFVLSATVSLLFIIEKLPTTIERLKQLKRWIDAKKRGKPSGGE